MSVLQFNAICVTSLSRSGAFQSGTIWSQLSPVLLAASQNYDAMSTCRHDTADGARSEAERYQAQLEVQCDYVKPSQANPRVHAIKDNDKITITACMHLLHDSRIRSGSPRVQ